jgi:hypothetical protein
MGLPGSDPGRSGATADARSSHPFARCCRSRASFRIQGIFSRASFSRASFPGHHLTSGAVYDPSMLQSDWSISSQHWNSLSNWRSCKCNWSRSAAQQWSSWCGWIAQARYLERWICREWKSSRWNGPCRQWSSSVSQMLASEREWLVQGLQKLWSISHFYHLLSIENWGGAPDGARTRTLQRPRLVLFDALNSTPSCNSLPTSMPWKNTGSPIAGPKVSSRASFAKLSYRCIQTLLKDKNTPPK